MKEYAYTETELLAEIQLRIFNAGSARKFAALCGESPKCISDILAGRRHPSPKILRYFGIRPLKVLLYYRDTPEVQPAQADPTTDPTHI